MRITVRHVTRLLQCSRALPPQSLHSLLVLGGFASALSTCSAVRWVGWNGVETLTASTCTLSELSALGTSRTCVTAASAGLQHRTAGSANSIWRTQPPPSWVRSA